MTGWTWNLNDFAQNLPRHYSIYRENRLLVTDEPVEFEWLKFKTSGQSPIILKEFIEYTSI